MDTALRRGAGLGGALASSPAAVSAVGGSCPAVQDVFVVGDNHQVYENRANGGFAPIGGSTPFRPAVARLADGRTDVWVVGDDSALWTATRPSDSSRGRRGGRSAAASTRRRPRRC